MEIMRSFGIQISDRDNDMAKRFRVIQGGRGDRESVEAPMRLFKAHSVGNLTRGDQVYHDVKFYWYCLERDQAPIPFQELIVDYERLDERHRKVLEREVQRYFTGDEIVALRDYLNERYGLNLLHEEVSIPVRERGYLFEEGDSVVYDFLDLSEKEHYPLPFKVWGYYTIRGALSSPSLEKGVQFLKRAFELLNITERTSSGQLEALVKEIYEKDRLIVKDGNESE